jgi:hypothetical protein
MSNPATIADLEARWRPFTSDELPTAQARLDDAWAIIQNMSTGFDDTGTNADAIIYVVCAMVLRVLKNPDGHRTESSTIDDSTESWTIDQAVSSGFMYITDDELRLIGAFRPRAGSFSLGSWTVPNIQITSLGVDGYLH